MNLFNRRFKYYLLVFLKHDFKASITVFFVALPLCLGVALASNAPLYSGLIAGIVGGIVITFFSKSQLSVSGPAAGLTAITAAAIIELQSIELFFVAVVIAGFLQIVLGTFRLGGFTHFIPSAVIKGMLAAIGMLLISKQIPPLIGYDQPQYWTKELFNVFTFRHGFDNIQNLYNHTTPGAIIISILSILFLIFIKKYLPVKFSFIPASILTVVFGILLALFFNNFIPALRLAPSQFVSIPEDFLAQLKVIEFDGIIQSVELWKTSVVICFVASLETLLSLAAIDKLDPYNRISPPNRELVAQGTGNIVSGLLGGLPVTAVIVRSSANAEAGARTKLSGILHGIWLLLAVLFAVPLIRLIPYCILAVILIRTGYNLAKPKMIYAVYKQGSEQFLPFIVTVTAILFTDLLIGVIIGLLYSFYFLIKHTYRAGFVKRETDEGHTKHIYIDLALNVSFLNKKRIMEMLDQLPAYSIVEINGKKSVYIDRDVLEIIQDFKVKAHNKHIELNLINIPEVETIGLH
jgi:MFS superfamily sulfate permease-like transporter